MSEYKVGDWVKGRLMSSYTAHLPPRYSSGVITFISPAGNLTVLDEHRLIHMTLGPKYITEHKPVN